MVPSPNGKGVILLGCRCNDPDHPFDNSIYELSTYNGILEWKTKTQKIKYPRYNSVSMLVPDELVTCQ